MHPPQEKCLPEVGFGNKRAGGHCFAESKVIISPETKNLAHLLAILQHAAGTLLSERGVLCVQSR
jgi:hypothetical protein